jgi:hypothetical protein
MPEQYRKIDIYVNGQYVCSTTQRRNIKEAKEKFVANPVYATIGDNGVEMRRVKDMDISRVVCKYSDAE